MTGTGQAFVGRERELDLLLAGLDALREGRGSLFLLAGEPGIGKTRLADELTDRARQGGATVVWGAAWDGGGAPAWWPWREIVRALRPSLPEPDERLRRELGPIWGDDATDAVDRGDDELLRFRRFDALRALLSTAAARGPLVVVLDDLHAADRASLLALAFVARALRSLPVLLVATHREAEARLDPDLGALIGRVAREGQTVRLGRLDREHVSALLDALDPVGPALVDQVYETSGGNPLFVSEAVRLVRTGRRPSATSGGVTAFIRERLARFDAETRAALEAAAILGREVDKGVLAAVAGLAPAALDSALRAATLASILDDPGDGTVRFAHGLFREELVGELAPGRRAELHLRAGEALARLRAAGHDAAEEAVARHLLRALPAGDAAAAVAWAVRAGERALRSLAPDRAAELLEGALGALDRLPPDPARRIDIELLLAEALARSGRAERSASLCRAAADQARALGDGPRLARAALALGAEIRIAIVDRSLVAILQEALAMLAPGERALRALCTARLAGALQPAPDPNVPVDLARQAIALARDTDERTLATTLYTAGSALVDYAPPAERIALARELVALSLPRGELVLAQRGYLRMAIDALELDDVVEADFAIDAHVKLGLALGHPRWRWQGALLRSMRALMEGRWADAEAAQAEAASLGAASDDPNVAPCLSMHRLGTLRVRESGGPADLAAAWHPSLDGLEQTTGIGPLLRAAVLVRIGEVAAARRQLEAVPPDSPYFESDPISMAAMSEVVARTGLTSLADRLLRALDHLPTRTVSWGVFGMIWEGPVAQFRGALLAHLGRHDEACAAFEEALAAAESIGSRPLVARLRHEKAAALLARGGPGDAALSAELLESAAAAAAELGMIHLGARIDATRARAPARTGAAVPAPPAAPPYRIEREGDYWTIESGGESVRIKHSRGLEMLERILREPGREIHVLDLGGGEPGRAVDAGDAGEALDATAKAAYRARIAALREELAEAEQWADAGRSDRLRAELSFIEEELARAVGLGGRDRRSAAVVERARVNVQKRLRGVVAKIRAGLPELGRHLEREIKTGTYVVYRP